LGFVRDGWRRAYADDYPDTLIDESRRKVKLALDRIDKALESGPWLLGDNYSLADIDTFAIARSIPLLAPELIEGRTRIGDWLAAIEERPAVRTALATGGWERPETCFAPGPEHARWG